MTNNSPQDRSKVSAAQWKQTRDRGSPWLIKLIIWIIRNLGRTIGRLCLFPIVGYFILTSSTRRFSRRYLQRNFKLALKTAPGLIDLFRHYYSFANMLLDRVYFLTGKTRQFDIQLHHPEVIYELLEQRKGAVLLGSHLGNFDVLRALANERDDIKIRALMYESGQQNINRVFAQLNPSLQRDVIAIGTPDAMIRVQQDMENGYLIGILADRVEHDNRTCSCQFFGQPVEFPSGPLIVAHLLKAPVILCFALHRGANRYDVYFHLLSRQVRLPRQQRDEALQQLMQKYADTLQQHALSYPYNWYNFYDYWKDFT